MTPADLSAVCAIAERVHPGFPERPEVFAERLALFPDGCRMAECEDAVPLGYCITHPARRGAPPKLDSLLGALDPLADVLHLHDVALLPEARGQGLGGQLMTYLRLLARQKGLGQMSLVAVYGSHSYWHLQGFDRTPGGDPSYGGESVYMLGSP